MNPREAAERCELTLGDMAAMPYDREPMIQHFEQIIREAIDTALAAERERAAQDEAALADAERGWRPISEAPKDGTEFLALVPPYRRNGRQHQMVGCFAPNGRFVAWPGRWNYEPTHFMPVPQPPAEAGGRDE